jgi:hypothetical protein
MRSLRHTTITAVLGAGIIGITVLSGCVFNPAWKSDRAEFFTTELAEATESIGDVINSSQAKTTAAATETVSVDVDIEPYTYDSSITGYVRRATCTTSEGYERIRVDTVYFYEDGSRVRIVRLGSLDRVEHYRHVAHAKNGVQADVDITLTMDVVREENKVYGVWNGDMAGTYDNEQIAEGEVDSVTRQWKVLWWGYPESGRIYLDFPNFKYEITYAGGGSATATITNKRRDRVREINVNVNR